MRPYWVTSLALDEFLNSAASSTMISSPLDGSAASSPRVRCAAACLSRRSSRSDRAACNAFVYSDGVCSLGYMEPNWLMRQREAPGDSGKVYFDIELP